MLSEQEFCDACFNGLWIETHEPEEALAEIRRMAQENEWAVKG